MFGVFKTPAFCDPQLGALHRRNGLWRGHISMCGETATLAVWGPRSEPDARSLELAREASTSYASWQPQLAQAMLEHCAPYADAVASGEAEPPENGMPDLAKPSDVWPHASIEFVQVAPVGGELIVEIGYRVAWDEEHTLGARFREGRLIELNGSVLPP